VPNLSTAGLTDAQKTARNRMMVELLRWYEQFAFPAYAPAAVDAAETGLTLGFNDPGLPAPVQLVPRSHLCHTSVTTWCMANGNVNSNGGDKKARCARLTADVVGKTVEMLNAYLASGEFTAGVPSLAAKCTCCHTQTAQDPTPPVAAGMECTKCHPPTTHAYPPTTLHDPASDCDGCH
jgi:hypothetical protein